MPCLSRPAYALLVCAAKVDRRGGDRQIHEGAITIVLQPMHLVSFEANNVAGVKCNDFRTGQQNPACPFKSDPDLLGRFMTVTNVCCVRLGGNERNGDPVRGGVLRTDELLRTQPPFLQRLNAIFPYEVQDVAPSRWEAKVRIAH